MQINSKEKDKNKRILGIYSRLLNGLPVRKSEEATRYNVNERTIQRDIDDIRDFLEDTDNDSNTYNTVIYDRKEKGFRLDHINRMKLSNSEVLAICKILLDSRAFTKKEMTDILGRLIENCVPKATQELVSDLIDNEAFHYIEPRHKKNYIDTLWDIGQAIHDRHLIEMEYTRQKDKKTVTRIVKPVAIIFSEYYFYLTAFIDDEETRRSFDVINDASPTIYRVDRINRFKVLGEKYIVPYASRFEEGEFRKRIQFMYGGKLRRIKFEYSGINVEAILDRLPTAKILSENDGRYLIQAEVFGDGVDMWLRSQGDWIEVKND